MASSKQSDESYVARARVFKALADPHRLRILDLLSEEGELCGTDLADRVGISLALLSHHWKVLIDAGLITREQRGQTKFCQIECARLQAAMVPWPAPPDAPGTLATQAGDCTLIPKAAPPKKKTAKKRAAAKKDGRKKA